MQPAGAPVNRKDCRNTYYDEIEAMVLEQKRANEANLLDLSEDINSLALAANHSDAEDYEDCINTNARTSKPNVALNLNTVSAPSGYCHNKLPSQSIIYDYTIQPIGVLEHRREYLPQQMQKRLSFPFLRDVYIDGIGLIKAYRKCCNEEDSVTPKQLEEKPFPLIPIIRCLFYWISKGHRTILCYPGWYNPIVKRQTFCASDEQIVQLSLLKEHGLLQYFEVPECECRFTREWFTKKMDESRGCLITTVAHYTENMPTNINTCGDTYLKYGDKHYSCPGRLLQPFYVHKGALMFFALYKNPQNCVADIILDDDINTEEEFQKYSRKQLSFIEQAKHLKLCYDMLPKQSRVREAMVMVELLSRLKYFL